MRQDTSLGMISANVPAGFEAGVSQ